MGRTRSTQGIDPRWSDRQLQVLDLIAAGRTNPEIAERLGITLDGAKWHVREVLTKLGVENREQAAEYWRGKQSPVATVRRSLTSPRTNRILAWVAGSAALGAAGVLGLLLVAGDRDEEEPQPERALVFEISDDSGESYLLTVSSKDGRELSRLSALPSTFFGTAGRHLVRLARTEVRVMLPDGTGDRLLYTATAGKIVSWAYVSPDGSRLAVVEQFEEGGGDQVTLVEVESGVVGAQYRRDQPEFSAMLGSFQSIWWHADNRSITIGSGGVQVEGDHEFRQSTAHISAAGIVHIITADASGMVSPDGEQLLAGTPATPGCMGFVATHRLEVIDLATGDVRNAAETQDGGLKPIGWLPPRRAIYLLEADAGCRPSEPGATYWELPEIGDPIQQDLDPFQQLDAQLMEPVIEVQCGDFPKSRWGEGSWAHVPGGRGGGGCQPVSRSPFATPDPAAEQGWLFVQGHQVARMGRFMLIGEVEVAPPE